MTGKRHQTSPIGSPSSGNVSDTSSKEHDRLLPIANVGRIMKKSLPPNAKISKEAKVTVQECASEFISFITGEASDKCQREKRKTINGDDLLWAMTTLGFENYVGPLKVYLNKNRETEADKNCIATARQEDHQSPTNAAINHGGACEFDNGNAAISATATEDHFQGYSRGFFSLGDQVINHPLNYWDGGKGTGYGENLMIADAFNTRRIHGHGNGDTTMAAHLHGFDWL
ncbi:hypothetical protein DITRI_Ditri16bG0071100 [Diplodiscus trichospermus]